MKDHLHPTKNRSWLAARSVLADVIIASLVFEFNLRKYFLKQAVEARSSKLVFPVRLVIGVTAGAGTTRRSLYERYRRQGDMHKMCARDMGAVRPANLA